MAVAGVRLRSATSFSDSAGGGCNNHCVSPMPAAVVHISQTPEVPSRMSSQASSRRLNISRAPTRISTSSGTGGSSKAPTRCFHDSSPRA
jgi:hypothetical protein